MACLDVCIGLVCESWACTVQHLIERETEVSYDENVDIELDRLSILVPSK